MNLAPAAPSPAPTAPSRRQRLATFNARHSHELFSIARSFVERLAPTFPPVARMIRLDDKTSRFDFGCAVAALCKHADDLSAVAPMIESLGARMREQGFTSAHVPEARSALMGALRHHTGADWNAQSEQDWFEVCNEFCASLNLREAKLAGRRTSLRAAA